MYNLSIFSASEGGEKDKRPTFYQAIDFVNVLYERTLTEGSERNWLPHVPFMFDIDIVTGTVSYDRKLKVPER